MALLSDFTINSKAIEQGEWLSPGEEYDDFMLLVRPMGDAYQNLRAAKMRKAASNYAGDVQRIPADKVRDIIVDCLKAHVVFDIRGLAHAPGKPVTLDEFFEIIRQEEGGTLFAAAISTAARAGQGKAEIEKEAAGN